MDRAGGRGQPPTQSDLPHTLHGSLIIPSENWEDKPPIAEGSRASAAVTPIVESPQQLSYPYTPSPFEEGSSRGSRTSQGYFDPESDHPPPPKRRRAAGSSERLPHVYPAGPSTAVASHSKQDRRSPVLCGRLRHRYSHGDTDRWEQTRAGAVIRSIQRSRTPKRPLRLSSRASNTARRRNSKSTRRTTRSLHQTRGGHGFHLPMQRCTSRAPGV